MAPTGPVPNVLPNVRDEGHSQDSQRYTVRLVVPSSLAFLPDANVCSVMAGLFFICSVVGAVYPYFSKTYKDVEHTCCRCGCKLATFHIMSGTEIHVFPGKEKRW